MKTDFWLERWRLREIGFHQPLVNASLQRWWPALDLPPDCAVFVPLCGKSLDLRWLHALGHPVIGVELAETAVREFYAEGGEEPVVGTQDSLLRFHANGITIYCGDYFALRPEHLAGVAAVYDRAALVALPPEMRRRYAAHLQALLPGDSRILQLTMEYRQEEMAGPPFAVTAAELQELYGASHALERLDRSDIWASEPKLRERGVSSLHEGAYLLRSRARRCKS